MDQVKIGRFVAECRKGKGLTQAKLAEMLGITDRAVSKWETGKSMPDAALMLPLCGRMEYTKLWCSLSASGLGLFPHRSNVRLIVEPLAAYPYLQSLSKASPYPESEISAHLCPQTSNFASSQVVLKTVGRST